MPLDNWMGTVLVVAGTIGPDLFPVVVGQVRIEGNFIKPEFYWTLWFKSKGCVIQSHDSHNFISGFGGRPNDPVPSPACDSDCLHSDICNSVPQSKSHSEKSSMITIFIILLQCQNLVIGSQPQNAKLFTSLGNKG